MKYIIEADASGNVTSIEPLGEEQEDLEEVVGRLEQRMVAAEFGPGAEQDIRRLIDELDGWY
jgi:hypothetical protein